jgi:hypothetical protein
MRAFHLWGLFGVLIGLTVILTGCSLFFRDDERPSTGAEELMTADRWVIAAQGEDEPAACEQDLSRSEARQEAKEALKEEEEAQQLQQVLSALGKRLMPWRAQGCEVSADEEGNASAEGLSAQQTGGPETVLVEVPAGADAALYLVETGDEFRHNWVSLRENTDEGGVLTHMEVDWEGSIKSVNFFLPNETIAQDIADQVRQTLDSGDATEGAGVVWALGADELDWSRTKVVLLLGREAAEGEEVDAILVIPVQTDEAGSQALWGGSRRALLDPKQAVYVQTRVQKKKTASGQSAYQVTQSAPVVQTGETLQPRQFYNLCPYRYYGVINPLRLALCQNWDLPWTVERSTEVMSDFYNAIYTGPGSLSTSPSLAILPGQPHSLILAGYENIDPELLQEIYSRMSNPYVQESGIVDDLVCEGIGILLGLASGGSPVVGSAGSLACSALIEGIRWFFEALDEDKRNAILTVLSTLESYANNPDFADNVGNLILIEPLLGNFLSKLRDQWDKMGVFAGNRPEDLSDDQEFMNLLQWTIQQYAAAGVSIAEVVGDLGPAALAIPAALDTYDMNFTDPRYPVLSSTEFIQLISEIVTYGDRVETDARTLVALLAGLLAEAQQRGSGTPSTIKEMITRILGTFDLAVELKGLGWSINRLGVQDQRGLIITDLIARKPISGLQHCGTCDVAAHVLIEPFLEDNGGLDLRNLVMRIVAAIVCV